MKINKNDPRLTSYVLGELSPADKSIIEAALTTDSELRTEILLIRKSTELLQQITQTETHRLSVDQRNAVFPRKKATWPWWSLSGGVATAALALMLFQQGHFDAAKVSSVRMEAKQEYKEAPVETPAAVADMKAEVPAPPTVSAAAPAAAAPAGPPPLAKEAVSADFAVRAKGIGLAASSGSGGSAYASGAPAKRKMFTTSTAKSFDQGEGANESLGSSVPASEPVSVNITTALTQLSPSETNPAVSAVVEAELKPGLQKCLVENLSKYVKYQLVFNLKWKLQNGTLSDLQITDPGDSHLLTSSLKNCLSYSVQQQKWPPVSNQFEYRLSFDSK